MADGLGPDSIYEIRHLNRSTWMTPKWYQDLTPIGTGAFGAVWYVFTTVVVGRVASCQPVSFACWSDNGRDALWLQHEGVGLER
jgi:hypothetical protein